MTKANYPDWVLKFKTKGIYVTKKADAYYLYRAHSERIKGTDKVRRVFDGYLGRVTEEDGLIPVKDKITSDILVYDHGLYIFLYSLSLDIYKGLKCNHRTYADLIFALSICRLLNVNTDSIQTTSLHFLLPKFSLKQISNATVIEQTERCTNMIQYFIDTRVEPADYTVILARFPEIHLVQVNGSIRLAAFDDELTYLLNKYKVEVEHYGKNI